MEATQIRQNIYGVFEWVTDDNKLSIHHLKHVITPRKQWNDYSVGEKGKAHYPGAGGEWDFIIQALGGKTLFFQISQLFDKNKQISE